MTLAFVRYEVTDGAVTLVFQSPDPGPGKPGEYSIEVTDTEVTGATTAVQFRALVIAKLKRKLLADGIASRLDPLIGQSVVV